MRVGCSNWFGSYAIGSTRVPIMKTREPHMKQREDENDRNVKTVEETVDIRCRIGSSHIVRLLSGLRVYFVGSHQTLLRLAQRRLRNRVQPTNSIIPLFCRSLEIALADGANLRAEKFRSIRIGKVNQRAPCDQH